MSLFYNAYFFKTQQPLDELQRKFSQVERIPNSDWLVSDFGDCYIDGAFEGEEYLTQALSEKFGEVIFVAIDTSNDQLDYEHSQGGVILRKLAWLSDGCQSTWTSVEGEVEDWEKNTVFSLENWKRTKDLVSYDRHLQLLPEAELAIKEQELQAHWHEYQYVLDGQVPFGDATFGLVILKHFFNFSLI